MPIGISAIGESEHEPRTSASSPDEPRSVY